MRKKYGIGTIPIANTEWHDHRDNHNTIIFKSTSHTMISAETDGPSSLDTFLQGTNPKWLYSTKLLFPMLGPLESLVQRRRTKILRGRYVSAMTWESCSGNVQLIKTRGSCSLVWIIYCLWNLETVPVHGWITCFRAVLQVLSSAQLLACAGKEDSPCLRSHLKSSGHCDRITACIERFPCMN